MSNNMGGGGSNGGASNFNSNGDYVKQIKVPDTDTSGLPGMTGSEKQIAWAEKIRENSLKAVHDALYSDADRWNQSVTVRENAISRGTDVSKWAKLKKDSYSNAQKSVKSKKEVADFLDASLRKFYSQHTKASTIIDLRITLPQSQSGAESLFKTFEPYLAKAKAKGKKFTAEQGAEAIKRLAEREGYRFK